MKVAAVVGAILFVVVLILLWIFPIVLFPHPGTNDTIELSSLELLVLLVVLLALAIALAVVRGPGATAVRVGLGVYLLGVAADFILGVATFGNLSNDRFLPLLFLPFPLGLAGLISLGIGAALSGGALQNLLRGLAFGAAGTVMVGVWTLLRGARDWLLAPYGFDITLLIVVVGAAVLLLGSATSSRPVAASSK
jgi:hypothetical protein